MMTLSKSQKQRAIEQMHELMQHHPLDADGMTEEWLDAEGLLESYRTITRRCALEASRVVTCAPAASDHLAG